MMLGFCFLSDDSQLLDSVLGLSNEIHQLAIIIAAGFMIFTLAWTYIMKLFNGDGGFPFSAFFRYIIFFIILLLYFPIMNVASGMLCAMGNYLPDVESVKDLINGAHTTWYGTVVAFLQDDTPNFLFDIVKANLLVMIRTVLEFVKTILASILFIIGPLAIAFDLLPFFNGVAMKWFRNFASVMLWSLTLSILDHFVMDFSQTFIDGASAANGFWYSLLMGGDSSDAIYMATNFCFIIMYGCIPVLTSWFVGRSTVGSVGSKIIGAGVAGGVLAAKVGIGAATGGGSMVASGASGGVAKGVASTVKPMEGSGGDSSGNSGSISNSKPSQNL